MPNPPFTIWTNHRLPEDAATLLREGISPHRLILSGSLQSSNLAAGAPDPTLSDADIAFGQPDPATILKSPRLKWIQLTTAGYTRYDREDFRHALTARGAALTNSSSVYADPCAEHALSMMLALARQLPQSCHTQLTDHTWPAAQRRRDSHLLRGQTAVLLGFGAIGQRLAQLLAPFHMRLIAIRRRPQSPTEPGLEILPESALPRVLPQADHLINLLPENPASIHFVTADRLALVKPTAIFYNIGRGTTVDQSALLSALQSHRIAAAYLDVTDPEPLPPNHPLWSAPNCFITPHTAGGQAAEALRLAEHFLNNLRRFEKGDPLHDRVI